MRRGRVPKAVALVVAAAFAGVGLAAGDCPEGALAQDSVTVETELGSFKIEVCVTHDKIAGEHMYAVTVTNVDIGCRLQSFAIHPLPGVAVELEPSGRWQTEIDEPTWWIWDGPTTQAIGSGSSRSFSFLVPDATPIASLSGAVFTNPSSSCGGNQLCFAMEGAAALGQQEGEDTGERVEYGQLCQCVGKPRAFQKAQQISVPSGYKAEYVVAPTGLSDVNDVLVTRGGVILVVSARKGALQKIGLDGTIQLVAPIEGYDIEIDGTGNVYGYNIVSGTVFAFDSSWTAREIARLPGTVFGSPLAVTPDGTLFIAHNAMTPAGPGKTTLLKLRLEAPQPIVVATLPEFVTALASDVAGKLYAVTSWGEWLSRIDTSTGAIEHLRRLGVNDVGYHGLATDDDGTVYVATDEGAFRGAVYRVPDLGDVEKLAEFDNGRIEGLAIRDDGSLVAVQALAGGVYLIGSDGTLETLVEPSGLVTPHSIAFAPCGDLVVVADEAGLLMIVCPNGEVKPFAEAITFQAPQTFVAFTQDGRCVVGESAPGFPSRVSVYSPEGERATVASDLDGASGVAVEGDGSILVSETAGGRILRLRTDGGVDVVADELDHPQGLALSTNGTIYAVVGNPQGQDVPAMGDAVIRIEQNGHVERLGEAPGAAALAVGQDGTLYIGAGSRVLRREHSGAIEPFAGGFELVRGLAFDEDWNLYVADDLACSIVRIAKVDALE